jgi:hypothetical protein
MAVCEDCEESEYTGGPDVPGQLCCDCLLARYRKLQAELAAAREREAKLRAAWPEVFGFGRLSQLFGNWRVYTKAGWIIRGKTRDDAINAAAGIEEPAREP